MEIKVIEYIPQENDNTYTNSLIECMVWCWLFKTTEIAANDLEEEMSKWERYFLAEKNWKVVGFGSWWPRNLHDRRWEYELFHIGSIEKWVGKMLFNTLVENAKEHYKQRGSHLRKFYLYTWKSNENAHGFYEHLGMELTWASIDKFAPGKIELEYSLSFDKEWNTTPASATLSKDQLPTV